MSRRSPDSNRNAEDYSGFARKPQPRINKVRRKQTIEQMIDFEVGDMFDEKEDSNDCF